MTTAIVRMPDCPSEPTHGQMRLRPLDRQTYEQRWCGVWYDCERCHSSILLESVELKAHLAQLRTRFEASEMTLRLL